MKIIQKKTADLIPYVNNARTHSEQQVLQIAASIKEFGFTNPVLVDGDNGIIAGHGRVLAAKKLNLNEVPTIELKHLTKTQKRAYIIADNRLAELSGWDDEMLKLEMIELNDLDFDLTLTGFDDFVIGDFELPQNTSISGLNSNQRSDDFSFQPNTNPTYSHTEIKENDFNRAGENIEKQLTGTIKHLKEVICPNCGEEFHVE